MTVSSSYSATKSCLTLLACNSKYHNKSQGHKKKRIQYVVQTAMGKTDAASVTQGFAIELVNQEMDSLEER